jgi:hypothetical protein
MITGACFCKAVQYELLAESQMQGLCYCTDCQTVGGTSHWTSYAVAPSDFRLVRGELTPFSYDPGSGREVIRHFCKTCGTQIMVQSDALGVASVNAMTFDDQTQFAPQVAYFSESAPHWCEVDVRLSAFGGD